MKKKGVLLIILGALVLLILAQIGLDLLQFRMNISEPRTNYGTIVRKVENGYEKWGLEIEKGIIIRHEETVFFSSSGLPERLKQEGLKVRFTYIIEDVTLISSDIIQ